MSEASNFIIENYGCPQCGFTRMETVENTLFGSRVPFCQTCEKFIIFAEDLEHDYYSWGFQDLGDHVIIVMNDKGYSGIGVKGCNNAGSKS